MRVIKTSVSFDPDVHKAAVQYAGKLTQEKGEVVTLSRVVNDILREALKALDILEDLEPVEG